MRLSKQVQLFKERLNYSICLNLLKTRRSPNIAFKLEISEQVIQFLVKKYKINGKFQKCSSIFIDLGLESENVYKDNDSHSVRRETFALRLMKKRPIEMKLNINTRKLISAPVFLSVRFLRFNRVALSNCDNIFC